MPPRAAVQRGRAAAQQKSVTFTYTCEWKLTESNLPGSFLKLTFPPIVPKKINPTRIHLTEVELSSIGSFTLPCDDALVENMMKPQFNLQINFPVENYVAPIATKGHKPSIKKPTENFIPDILQLDIKKFLLEEIKEITTETQVTGFEYFKIKVEIDKAIMEENFYRKFTPIFIHFISVSAMPNRPYPPSELAKSFAPVHFIIRTNGLDYYVLPQKHAEKFSVDVLVCVTPHTQSEIIFEIHDRDPVLPNLKECIGSGLITEYKPAAKEKGLYLDPDSIILPHMQTRNPYGFAKIMALPERKSRVLISASHDKSCFVSAGNFFESQTELKYQIYDPSCDLPVQVSPPPSPVKGKVMIKVPKITKVAAPLTEDIHTTYYRWIFTCDKKLDGTQQSENIMNRVSNFHSSVLNEPNKSVLSTINFALAIKKTYDVITGFHFSTPEEEVIILETRTADPNTSTNLLDGISFPLRVHALSCKEMTFPYPRLYDSFDCLVKEIDIPIPMRELLNLDGLYFHKSSNSILFPVITKLANLFSCMTFVEAVQCDMFPTAIEMLQLLSKTEMMQAAPPPKPRNKLRRINTSTRSNIFGLGSSLSLLRSGLYPSSLLSMLEEPVIEQKKPKYQKTKTSLYEASLTPREAKPKKDDDNRRLKFQPYGNQRQVTKVSPRGLISNGDDMEIWYVDDPNQLIEDGYEITIIKKDELCKSNQKKRPATTATRKRQESRASAKPKTSFKPAKRPKTQIENT